MSEWGMAADFQNTVDTKKIQELMKNCNVQILVGFPSGRVHVPARQTDDKPIETSDLARDLHFGTSDYPARPFLDDGLNSQKEKINQEIKKEIEKTAAGEQANWDKIGTMAVGAVQEFVRGDFYKSNVPNSPETIKVKGSDTPLIDGGDLINSCSYIVENK